MYLYLTTTGRVTSQPCEIEIWFTEHGDHFYPVDERESANCVRNIQSQPQVKVRVGDAEFNAIACVRAQWTASLNSGLVARVIRTEGIAF